jgi:hypothetical protein
MIRTAAYEENLNGWGLGEPFGHEQEWQAPRKYYPRSEPHRPRYDHNEDEPADIIFYTDGHISRLRKRYELRGGTAVENFLKEHSFLVLPLIDAYDRIRDYFGPKARLALKVSKDPEARQDEELFVVVQTGLSPKAARTLLAELDRDWWLDAFPATQGKMTISLEYL